MTYQDSSQRRVQFLELLVTLLTGTLVQRVNAAPLSAAPDAILWNALHSRENLSPAEKLDRHSHTIATPQPQCIEAFFGVLAGHFNPSKTNLPAVSSFFHSNWIQVYAVRLALSTLFLTNQIPVHEMASYSNEARTIFAQLEATESAIRSAREGEISEASMSSKIEAAEKAAQELGTSFPSKSVMKTYRTAVASKRERTAWKCALQ